MLFDILVSTKINDAQIVLNYGTAYLKSKTFKTEKLSLKICRFCHIEHATAAIVNDIQNKGYSLIEMENCD
ncbi:DUF2024 family protein [Oceanihabitans sp. IOP_32]|uniref:DUF2024 family protein n=1 Tax=Oceanihabitans sp. IOP_32 TaxID=2529032 RepID=UPI0012939CE6|nr:DUF2024 family protein [Oceanihabitans sp. IOP_32]QFZ53984.1 DUF2024 family protein [Oceanihabitans sp. IOP_32]